ncbi:MAG: hypothetical protein JW888_00570 [Pirellulales bacterium]|nr:hypothetical protein [Pirellulales bacterium]
MSNHSSANLLTEPQQWLRLGGIDDDEWAEFQDTRPWTGQSDETLQRILLRLARLSPDDFERWSSDVIDWDRIRADPNAFRGRFFRLRGRIRSIAVVRLAADVARRFEVKQYYRVEMLLNGTGQPVVVFSRTVPKTWHQGGTINQPGEAWGMYLRFANDTQQLPIFAAPRLAFFPDDQLLGQLGMDVGLLDDLVDRQPIRNEERECFYQMLAAVKRAQPGQLRKEARRQLAERGDGCYSVVPLFNDPARQHGKLVMFSGTVRRALRVRVEDPDIRRRFGIDHYFELSLFPRDSQGNPLVFCVLDVPKNMPLGDGPEYSEPVTVAGFFLKSRAYRSALVCAAADGNAPLQLAPLLIGSEPVWGGRSTTDAMSIWGAVGGVMFVLILVGIWLWLLVRSRADRRFRQATRNRINPHSPLAKSDASSLDDENQFDFASIEQGGSNQSNPETNSRNT